MVRVTGAATDGERTTPPAGVTASGEREAAAEEGELVEDFFFFFFRDDFEDVRTMVAMIEVVVLVVGTSNIRCRTIVAVVGGQNLGFMKLSVL